MPFQPNFSSLIMVVDPEADRRNRLIMSFGRDQVIDAISLHEAYSLVEEARPSFVILSEKAARESGLDMFIQLTTLVGASCVVYGDRPPPDLPAHVPWVQFLYGDDPRRILSTKALRERSKETAAQQSHPPKMIVIGASTGGISALEMVLSKFPAECPPTLIVQHIRSGFADSMVQRLERGCAPRVTKALHGVPLERGTIYVATEDKFHLTVAGKEKPRCTFVPGTDTDIHRPSVNALFHSAATFGSRVAAALLTGMGADGAAGMAAIRAAGGLTVAQNKETCTVYGMPRVAAEMGAASVILPLDRIAPALLAGMPLPAEGSIQ